jgi:beta-lysine 5,6-aminomutase alpha subunit
MPRLSISLKPEVVAESKETAKGIVEDVFSYISKHTTDSIERSVLRFFGIDGVDSGEIPLPNVVVDHLRRKGILDTGSAYWIANACVANGKDPQTIAQQVGANEIDLTKVPSQSLAKVYAFAEELTKTALDRIERVCQERDVLLEHYGDNPKPYKYVIVATGNIYEDVSQARAASEQGADIIAVIRSTAQSLLDYVPYGPTTEGFGGTYATQENFRIMRSALDEIGAKQNRYIRLTNYASGLCMPEIAMMASWEGLDFLLNDSMYGILFRDINMKRTFVDQYFSRLIVALSHITINTGEDNYLTTSDAIEKAFAVTASQLINEAFAKKAGMQEKHMGLGHAFEINPDIENGFLYELAHAMLSRELFPEATLKYMPPTKFMTGNVFKGYAMNTLYNLASVFTGQDIQLLGMLTEAIHTPYLQDRYLALLNAGYVFNNARNLGNELEIKKGGFIETRANEVLLQALELLKHTKEVGLMRSIQEAHFADIARSEEGGKGLSGVFAKSEGYYNPVLTELEKRLHIEVDA